MIMLLESLFIEVTNGSIHFNFNFQHFYIFTIYILFLLFLTQERKDQAWVSRGGEDEG